MAGRKGRSGPRGKPRHMHVVDGTHRPSRHGSKEDAKRAMARARSEPVPRSPGWLPELARKEWRRLAPLLHKDGLLERRDLAAFAAYCRAVAELQQAQEMIAAEGLVEIGATGAKVRHPAVIVAKAAADQIRAFAIEFGLTPVARNRITDSGDGGKTLAEILRGQSKKASGAER